MTDESLTERLLRQDRAILLAAITTIVVIACFYTVFGVGMKMSAIGMTKMAGNAPMGAARAMTIPVSWVVDYAILVFLMWWVMMIAMMLPSASPTILLYTAMLRHSQQANPPAILAALFLAGYLVIWAIFSVLATALQWSLELRGLVSPTMMVLTSSVLAGTVLIAAGGYQFSSIKEVCLDHCRSPMHFLVKHRRPGILGAFLMGIKHGAFCLGCCWFLMALLFVGGIMNLYWIAGLALLVILEKFTPVGRQLARVAGILLIGGGFWMLSRALTSIA
jgi:predicted metal-binding membrane protein